MLFTITISSKTHINYGPVGIICPYIVHNIIRDYPIIVNAHPYAFFAFLEKELQI